MGFPQVVGAIDGTHIPITRPVYNQADYYRHVARGGSVGSDEPPSQIKGPLFRNERSTFLRSWKFSTLVSTLAQILEV